MSRNAFNACAQEIEEREDERNNLRMERESMKANNKELAFPNSSRADGMTLRDYFAAKAMQAFIGQGTLQSEWADLANEMAQDSYDVADAMLAVRNE